MDRPAPLASLQAPPALSVGIVLMPDFTILALAAFIDTLRLAADQEDRSRPLRCRWTILSADGRAVRASSGVMVEADGGLSAPERFDYVVIVGGTLHRVHDTDAIFDYLRRADAAGVPLVGLCTGSVHLARAGLMDGYRACVSWLHRDELAAEFPALDIVSDALFVFDRQRITCAGGTSVVHLASELVERHVGAGASRKGLRIMLEERSRSGSSPQPPPPVPGLDRVRDPRVRRAILSLERMIERDVRPGPIAAGLGLSARQLNRLFVAELGCSITRFVQRMRLDRAERMIDEGTMTLTEIAAACGYADASHFSRSYRARHAMSPSEARRGGASRA